MPKTWSVTIAETVNHEYIIEAETKQEAENIAYQRFYDCDNGQEEALGGEILPDATEDISDQILSK